MTFKQILLFTFLSFKNNNHYSNFHYILSKKNKVVLVDINNFERKNNTGNNINNFEKKNNIGYDINNINNFERKNNSGYDINNIKSYYMFLKQPVVNIRSFMFSGMDERFNNTGINNSEVSKILNNNERKKLLDQLTDPKLSQPYKLKLIENSDYLREINSNQIKNNKMSNGGLMNDWNT